MIRVTIELVPLGIEARKRVIGQLEIANDGTGTQQRGNYKYRVVQKDGKRRDWVSQAVRDFPRTSCSPFNLLFRILMAKYPSNSKRLVAEMAADCPDYMPEGT